MVVAELERLVEERIAPFNVHVIDFTIKREGNMKSFELFIDSEQGITTEVCSDISRSVDAFIEESGIVKGPFRLTVSSPGIGRSLKFSWQYRKHIGRELSLEVKGEGGTRRIVGSLVAADNESLVLRVGTHGSQESVRFDDIVDAHVNPPW